MNRPHILHLLTLAALATSTSVTHADTLVKIGQVSPLTGELAHIGKDDENGVRLAIEDLNSKNLRIGICASVVRQYGSN